MKAFKIVKVQAQAFANRSLASELNADSNFSVGISSRSLHGSSNSRLSFVVLVRHPAPLLLFRIHQNVCVHVSTLISVINVGFSQFEKFRVNARSQGVTYSVLPLDLLSVMSPHAVVPAHFVQILVIKFEVMHCFFVVRFELSTSCGGVKHIFEVRTLLTDDRPATQLVRQMAYDHSHNLHVCLMRVNMKSSASRKPINHRVAAIVEFSNVSANILL
jgi:hypothetical protein